MFNVAEIIFKYFQSSFSGWDNFEIISDVVTCEIKLFQHFISHVNKTLKLFQTNFISRVTTALCNGQRCCCWSVRHRVWLSSRLRQSAQSQVEGDCYQSQSGPALQGELTPTRSLATVSPANIWRIQSRCRVPPRGHCIHWGVGQNFDIVMFAGQLNLAIPPSVGSFLNMNWTFLSSFVWTARAHQEMTYRTRHDVSSYMITYLPLNYNTPVLPEYLLSNVYLAYLMNVGLQKAPSLRILLLSTFRVIA